MLTYAILFIIAVALYGRLHKANHGTLPEWKYFKPFSMTWWVAVVPGVVGILISGEPLHGWADLATSLSQATGNANPSLLIYGSLGGIGLTGRSDK